MASDNHEPVQWHVETLVGELRNAVQAAQTPGNKADTCQQALDTMLMRGPDAMTSDLSTLVKVFENGD